MTLFQDRERAFEQMFVHDEEMRFRALALRNKMLGRWAAERLGLADEPADAYMEEIRNRVADADGEETVAAKLREDFAARSLDITESDIRRKMGALLRDAIEQVKKASG